MFWIYFIFTFTSNFLPKTHEILKNGFRSKTVYFRWRFLLKNWGYPENFCYKVEKLKSSLFTENNTQIGIKFCRPFELRGVKPPIPK